jgi:hypothetical protein
MRQDRDFAEATLLALCVQSTDQENGWQPLLESQEKSHMVVTPELKDIRTLIQFLHQYEAYELPLHDQYNVHIFMYSLQTPYSICGNLDATGRGESEERPLVSQGRFCSTRPAM